MTLKIVQGDTVEEQIFSIDGLLDSMNRKALLKTLDEKLAGQVRNLIQRLNAIEDHLGIIVENGPAKVVRQVKLVENTNVDNKSSS